MKQRAKYVLSGLLTIGSMALFSGCEDTSEASPQMQTDLLTGGSVKAWRIREVKRGATMVPQSSCLQDDTHSFSATKTYTLDNGATKCNASEPQQYTGAWSLSSSIILIREPGKADAVLEIKQLTSARLVVDQNVSGAITRLTYEAR